MFRNLFPSSLPSTTPVYTSPSHSANSCGTPARRTGRYAGGNNGDCSSLLPLPSGSPAAVPAVAWQAAFLSCTRHAPAPVHRARELSTCTARLRDYVRGGLVRGALCSGLWALSVNIRSHDGLGVCDCWSAATIAFCERSVASATGNNTNISGYLLASYAEENICI